MVRTSLLTAPKHVQTEIWAIAWPRPHYLSHPGVVIITALGTERAWFHTQQRLPVGTTLELCFALPDLNVEIVCGAVVKQATTQGRTTVAFTLLERHDQEQLNAWVNASTTHYEARHENAAGR